MTVRVVMGPSCAGKSTYLWGHRDADDLAVDYDRIAEALGNSVPHGASGLIGSATFRARSSAISSALESDSSSWIIHSNPTVEWFDTYMEAGAEFVIIDPGMDVCLARVEDDGRPEGTKERIEAWYDAPPEPPEGAKVTTVTSFTAHSSIGAQGGSMKNHQSRPPNPWFRVEAKAGETTRADVYVYDEIGESWWGGLSPKALVDEIAALDVDTLTVHVNSPGGAAWDGIAIMNALRAHRARVEVVIDGLAASAASVIAMAGDKVTMNRGSQMMIHDASGGCWGPSEMMEETASILHKLSDSIADTYAARAGGDRETWRAAMKAESWYTAEEAVEAGLADEWDGTTTAPVHDAMASFDMSKFRYQGRTHAPTPQAIAAHSSPVSPEPGNPEEKGVSMSDIFKAGVRDRLGLTDADATDEAVFAALDGALAAKATTVPEGAIVVDETAYAALKADADAGRKAMETIDDARRNGIVSAALADGRITAESKDRWRAQLDNDEEGIAAILASMPKNLVPVVEVGHSDSLTSADDALYGSLYGSTQKEA